MFHSIRKNWKIVHAKVIFCLMSLVFPYFYSCHSREKTLFIPMDVNDLNHY
jgi:hypothetical protein